MLTAAPAELDYNRADPMLQIGDQFERFQILSHLAQGGMSDIYRARDLTTGREVALKIPDPTLIGDPAQYERFQRELEVTRTLHHPAIQHGVASGQFNRTPYLVTELVEGEALRDLITRRAPFPPAEALDLIIQIADGLAYCHEQGVIHRDLKPENILIAASGQPVILDFGLALTKGAKRVTYANLSSTAGTPEYMAPEQVEGQRGDARTDLYALGIVLYELLTGAPPFTGDNNLAIMAQHLNQAVPRLDQAPAGIAPHLAAVVARATRRKPEERYADLRAFIHDAQNLEQVDLSILERATARPPAESFWGQRWVKSAALAMALLAMIILIALIAQWWRGL